MKIFGLTVCCWMTVFTLFASFGCSQIHPTPEVGVVLQEEQPEEIVQPSTPAPQYYTHTIKWPGENLIRISRWYTGSANNWLQIVKANPAINPRRLRIGDAILIPEELMITGEPMPKSYRVPALPSNNKTVETSAIQEAVQPSEDSHANTGEIELFGPIDLDREPPPPKGSDSPLPLETIE